ncbi:MAG: hypothetical protein JW908_11610 [Anaerolineales bacterium]|nr:hypothetical protein [Anaerolineales bacterium]
MAYREKQNRSSLPFSLIKKMRARCFWGIGLFIGLSLTLFLCASCQLKSSSPALEWDPSPQAQIIRFYDPIQFPGLLPTYQDERMENHIPEAVVYGDGRILWVEYVYGGGIVSRRVMQGHFSHDEMIALLQRFKETGFFSWKDQYGSSLVEDGPPSSSLNVKLSRVQKGVVVNSDPPDGYRALCKLVGTGAGAKGVEYTPERAYLSAYPQFFGQDLEMQFPRWPVAEMGFSLQQLSESNGRYVDEETLRFTWNLVNADPAMPLVEDQGEIYLITLRVPNLSGHQPPDP